MAAPIIHVNNSTGDDANSGDGGTVVSGTGASVNGTTTVDVSADSPDLSGIPTDGSRVLFVETASGRRFARITGADNTLKTFAVHDAFDTTASGLNWSTGGKRANVHQSGATSLNSLLRIPYDAEDDWQVEVEYTGTDYQTRNWNMDAIGGGTLFRIYGSGAQKPVLLHDVAETTHVFHADSNTCHVHLDNLCLVHDHTSNFSPMIDMRGTFKLSNCEAYGLNSSKTNTTVDLIRNNHNSTHNRVLLINCHIYDLGGQVVTTTSGTNTGRLAYVIGCKIHNLHASAFDTQRSILFLYNNEIWDINGNIIDVNGSGSYVGIVIAVNNTLHDGTDGIEFNNSSQYRSACLLNNSISGNSGYGIAAAGEIHCEDFNNLYDNTLGNTDGNHTLGANTITTDPQYTDAANGDFTLNGTNRQAAGGPAEVGNPTGTRDNFLDIGSKQEEDGGGGGSAGASRLINGGLVS